MLCTGGLTKGLAFRVWRVNKYGTWNIPFEIRWLATSKILEELDFNAQKNIVLKDSPR